MPEPLSTEDAWFWTPAWQAKEREVDVHVPAGQSTEFSCLEDFIRRLELFDREATGER